MDKLRKYRGTLRGMLTRLDTYINQRATMSDEDITARFLGLKETILALREVHEKIENKTVDDKDHDAYDQEQEYRLQAGNMSTFQVYNVSDDEDHPVVARSASRVLTKAISSKVDIGSTASKILAPFRALTRREEEYDPHKHRNMPHPTSYGETMMHLLKACMGAGLLAVPNAMSRLGFVLGIPSFAFLAFFSCYCLQLLILSQYVLCKKKKVGYLSFPESMRLALQDGPPCMRWSAGFFAGSVDFMIIIWQIGVCAIYLVFVGENIKQVMAAYGTHMPLRILICCEYPVLAIVCMVKDLKKLAVLSTLSNLCNLIGIVLVFYYLSEEDLEIDESHYKLKSLMDIPVFIGIVLFAYMAPGVILSVEQNMENPKEFSGWCGLFSLGTIIVNAVYTAMGIFGYLKYGLDCKGSITLNLPQSEKKAHVAKTAFAAMIYTSYPLQNFTAWHQAWGALKHKFKDDRTKDLALRIILSTIPFGLALAVPTLGPFIGLMGSLCLTIIGVLFPALVHCGISYPNNYGTGSWKLICDILIMIIGVICCLSGVYTSLLEIREDLSK